MSHELDSPWLIPNAVGNVLYIGMIPGYILTMDYGSWWTVPGAVFLGLGWLLVVSGGRR